MIDTDMIYTEEEKRFLISFEEKFGQLDRATEEMVIQAYRDGYKKGQEEIRKESTSPGNGSRT